MHEQKIKLQQRKFTLVHKILQNYST